MNDLPRPVLQRRQRTVQPLVLDDVHVLPAQLQQEVLLLVGPVLRPLALLEPLGRPQRTLQHPEMLDLLTFRRVRQFFWLFFIAFAWCEFLVSGHFLYLLLLGVFDLSAYLFWTYLAASLVDDLVHMDAVDGDPA